MQNFISFIQSVTGKIGTALSHGITVGGLQTTVGTVVTAVVVTGTAAAGGTAIAVNEFNATVKEPAAIVETVDNTSDTIDDVIDNITETNDSTTNDIRQETSVPSEVPSEEIPEDVHVHDYASNVIKDATCTEYGLTEYVCECGYSYTSETALESHTAGDWVIMEPATYNTEGLQTQSCTVCNAILAKEVIAKVECIHNYEITASSDSKCTEGGSYTYTCEICVSSYDEETDADGHDYSKSRTVEATCTQKGATYKICEDCGDEVQVSIIDMKGHSYIQNPDKENVEPTCETEGHKYSVCSTCGHTNDEVITKEHAWNEGEVVEEDSLAPTCTEAGYKIYKCANCDATKRIDLDALGHTESDWITENAATCTAVGTAIKTCTICGNELDSKTLDIIAHSYVLTDEATPTCIAADNNVYNCEVCGHEKTESVAALGHTAGEEIIVEATDLREGSVKQYCTECGTILIDEIIAKLPHTHEYATEIERQNATCTTDGFVKYQCRCETVKTETLTKTGHTAGEWSETKAPTYTETGVKTKYCVSCGVKMSEEELDVLPHECDYTEEISRTIATCTEKGMLTKACTICGERVETEILPTGHTAGEWTTENAATCTTDGLKVQKCTACEATVNSEVIPATGHTAGEWTTENATSCTADGLKVQKCTTCGTTVNSEAIPATGHTLGDWEETNEASCETNGTETKSCSACDYAESRSIPATGHSYGDWIVDVNPTEENEGSKHKECSKCDNIITEDIEQLPPHVHNYTETSRTESTCSAAGSVTYSCECGDRYSEEIDKINHNEGDWESENAATCTADGSKVKKCTSCGTTLRTETIEKIAHVYSETATVAATCTADGYTRYKCNSCDSTYDTVLPATGHDYGDAITETATCTHTGSIKYICAICRLENIEETSALGHNYVVTNTINPTCTTTGKTVYACNRNGCNASYEEEIPMIEHVYNTTTVEATCETDGYTIKTCENCEDESIEIQEGSATGHTAAEWDVTLQPTYTEKGSQTKSCVNCQKILETEEIPVLELPNGDAVYTITLKGGATTTVIGHYDEELAADLVDLVNAYRADNDLPTLTVSDYMSERAAKRGYETSHTWDHLKPNGGSAIASYGYSAENLAWYITRTTAQEIFDALKDCEDHNAIMLSSFTYNETAVSVFCKYVGEINGQPDYEYYWVQIFD